MQTKSNLIKNISIFACFIIVPLITITLAIQRDLLKYNFTFLSTQSNTKLLYYVWAITTITFACLTLYIIAKQFKLLKPIPSQILLLFVILIGSSLVPYDKDNNLLSFIHVSIAYIALIYFNYILFTVYNFMKLQSIEIGKYAGYMYVLQFTICFILSMMFGSISSLVEVVYTISTSVIFGILLITK